MNRNSTSGYGRDNFTYYIETTFGTYNITVDVKFYIQPPNFNSWESDFDYTGYTEILDTNITDIEYVDDDGNSTYIKVIDLSKQELTEIYVKIDKLVSEQDFGSY